MGESNQTHPCVYPLTKAATFINTSACFRTSARTLVGVCGTIMSVDLRHRAYIWNQRGMAVRGKGFATTRVRISASTGECMIAQRIVACKTVICK